VSAAAPKPDPVFRNSLREAWVILGAWGTCFIYTVTYCYLYGYLSHEPMAESTGPSIGALMGSMEELNRDPGSLTTPLGLAIPDWIFYGVVGPWIVCILFSLWFCLFYFEEDELETSNRKSEAGGESNDLH
jgi:hypothetical protein